MSTLPSLLPYSVPATPRMPRLRTRSGRMPETEDLHHDVAMPEWYPYLKALKENPFRQEFIYLTLRDPDSLVYRPYDLRVVPHSDVDPNHFYTMSASGVTHILDGEAEFITLERFEREFHLFTKTARKTIFRLYRIWKGFMCWKNYVRRKKRAFAKERLSATLFHLNPIFQRALSDIRSRCVDVAAMPLHHIEPDATLPLGSFLEEQIARKDECANALVGFAQQNAEVTRTACQEALNALQERLFGPKEEPTVPGASKPSSRATPWALVPPPFPPTSTPLCDHTGHPHGLA